MRLRELLESEEHCIDELDEGWKDTVTNLAMAGTLAAAGTGGMMAKQAASDYFGGAKEPAAVTQQVKQEPKAATKIFTPQSKQQATTKTAPAKKAPIVVQPVTDNPLERTLLQVAKANGLAGAELAAFMAQCAHETLDFKSLKEFGGSLDFRKYDPKYAPKKAKALGNKYIGDGARYKGRGFIQITGRWNYKQAGEELGLPLEKHPELVEKPEIAAKVSVWFWKHRVQPNVDNFHNVDNVTKQINPGMRGKENREETFKTYMKVAQAGQTAQSNV
jgi:predicted chitinase